MRPATDLAVASSGVIEPTGASIRGRWRCDSTLEAERRQLLMQLSAGKDADAVALHPNAAEQYRQKVADVRAALTKGDEGSREAIALVRDLIESITVTPTPPDEPLMLELTGNLAALMREPSTNKCSVVLVAGFSRDRHILSAVI